MPTDPSDPSSPKPSTRLMPTDEPKGGGGGIFFVILLLLLLGGGAAYYFMVYQPAAKAGATVIAPPTASGPATAPTPAAAKASPTANPSGNPTYNNAQQAAYVKQADDAFINLRSVKSGPFTDAFAFLTTAGGLSVVGLNSKEAIAARRDLVAKCQTANDEYEEFVKTQDATFKAELQKTPLVQNDMDYVLSDFSYKAQTDKNIQLRDLQRESFKTGDQMLAYLDKAFGNWSLNAAQHITFKKPADSNAFSALAKTYNDQVAAMNKLQTDIKTTADPNSVAAAPAASPTAASPSVSPTSPSASPASPAATAPAPTTEP